MAQGGARSQCFFQQAGASDRRQFLLDLGRADRCRRIGTHAAGIRAGVGLADALVVLAGRHRQGMPAISDHDVAGFLAVEEFLDHDACGGLAERQRDDDALAGGQAVGLDDDRCAVLAHVGQCRIELGEDRVARGRDIVAVQEILRERLGALELGGDAAGAEAAHAGLREAVDDAGDDEQHVHREDVHLRRSGLVSLGQAHDPTWADTLYFQCGGWGRNYT